jgi:hypothetical protein
MAFAMNAPALRGAAAPAVPWVPSDIAATKAWWTAADHGTARMTDDGAGLISSHTARVTAIALTAVTTARPTWSATGFNSAYPVLAFNGTTNVLAAAGVNAAIPTGSAESWIFAVADNNLPGATAGVRSIGGYGITTTDQCRSIGRFTVTSLNRWQSSCGVSTSNPTTLAEFNGPHMGLAKILPGTHHGLMVDGSAIATNVLGAVVTSTTATRMGANQAAAPGAFWSGGIAELLFLSALVQADIDKLFGWAAWAYGLVSLLPAGHPYKSARP